MIPLPPPLLLPDNQYIPDRPLVLLAAWLGCKPRYLNLYARIYASLGYNVMIRISSPATIVLASMTETTTTETKMKMKTHGSQYNIRNRSTDFILGGNTRTMEDIAHETIDEIANSQCCSVVIHVFSNGGAFLWEAMRRILYPALESPQRSTRPSAEGKNRSINFDSKSVHPKPTGTESTETPSATTEAVRNKLIGTVFDSSPADYSTRPDLLTHAIQRCSFGERVRIRSYLVLRAAARKPTEGGGAVSSAARRATEFWTGMRDSAPVSPELYIYSGVDSLAPLDPLRELIESRKRSFGGDRVWCREFVDSAHCGHGVAYPEEYARVVEEFLDRLGRGRSSWCSSIRIDANRCREEREDTSIKKRGNEDFPRSRL